MNLSRPVTLIGFIKLMIAFACVSCTGETNASRDLTADSFTFLPLKTVFEFTESEKVAFQQISSIKTDNYGNILVHDFRQPFLFMFDQEGNFVKKIGREGRGPGEFQQIVSFVVAQEHLWIVDSNLMKIEKFEYQNTEYVNINTLGLENEDLTGLLLGKVEEGILIKKRITIHANRKDNPTEASISLIDEDGGIIRDSIFMAPITEQMTLKGSEYTLNIGKIFGNRSLLAFDGIGRIYTLWTDSLAIDTYTVEGDRRRAFSHSLEPIRVTDEERDSILHRYARVRADLSRKLPDVKPVVKDLLIDDHQRIWVELLTEELGHGWFCFTVEGEPLYKIDIPKSGAELQGISGNRVFWNYLNDYGAPTIAVSEINISV